MASLTRKLRENAALTLMGKPRTGAYRAALRRAKPIIDALEIGMRHLDMRWRVEQFNQRLKKVYQSDDVLYRDSPTYKFFASNRGAQ